VMTSTVKSGSLVEQLARRIVAMRLAELPGDVLELAKRCVLDQLGIQLRGTTLPHTRPAVSVAMALGGAQEANVPLLGYRLPARYAAYVMANLGHSCEYDDSHFLCGHPGVCVIPPVLAIGEQRGTSGSDILSAIVAGYEAMVLSVGPIHPTTMGTGWHGTKVSGVFGAAAAAGLMFGLDEGAMAHALAIAGSESSGTTEYDRSGGEVKRAHPAMAVRSGIEAALLAQAGLTGPLTILEGMRGIYRLFGDHSEPQVEQVWKTEYHIRDVIFKLYPANGTHQAVLDALRHLIDEHSFGAGDVTRIVVSTAPWAVHHGGATGRPTDMISAQFNLGFSIAMRLLEGSNALPLYLDPGRWSNPAMAKISKLVTVKGVTFEPGESELGALVEVDLADGRHLARRQYSFRGQPDDPAGWSDIEGKFLSLVDGLLPTGRSEEIVHTVRRLEQLTDIRQLTGLLQR
jgi:2-methylcitrate dehydratase PrpD